MTHKIYDLAVKTGSYTDNQGEQKNRYENVGSVMQGDNGQFIVLKKTFNPAGVQSDPSKDSILISCFEPRQNGQQQSNQRPQQAQQSAPQQPQSNRPMQQLPAGHNQGVNNGQPQTQGGGFDDEPIPF